MAIGTEEAEKVFRSAEERFLVGDVEGALRVARKAKKRHLASLPALQSALTAYEVHAAERSGWYAVLGVGQPEPVTHDHDAIKKRYRRLCLVLHPDKNRSAAADGAFKLLQRAWEVLSARHPPGTVPDPGPGTGAKPRQPPPGAPDPDWWSSFFGNSPPPQAPDPDWWYFFGNSPPPGAPDPDWWSSFFRNSPPAGPSGRDWWSSYFHYKPPPERTWSSYGYTPPPERTWSSYGYTPPPPPFSSASSGNFNAWRSRYARKRGTAYCGHCGSEPESAARGGHHGTPGGRCHSCGTHSASGTAAEPPPPAGTAAEPPPRDHPPPRRWWQRDEKFTCPTECCRCKTPFSSLVSPGLCKLRCQACSYDAFVYVHHRHWAIAF